MINLAAGASSLALVSSSRTATQSGDATAIVGGTAYTHMHVTGQSLPVLSYRAMRRQQK